VKSGERDASKEHRQLLNELREAAAELLRASGNAATETTLRRVTTTLSAVAASGGFAPEPDGALTSDRDPPGFETFTGEGTAKAAAVPSGGAVPDEAERRRAEAERKRAEEEERQRRQAERERLSAALREARELLSAREREASRLRAELEAAEQRTKETRALLADIETKLGAL
jgi:hypothetical protein